MIGGAVVLFHEDAHVDGLLVGAPARLHAPDAACHAVCQRTVRRGGIGWHRRGHVQAQAHLVGCITTPDVQLDVATVLALPVLDRLAVGEHAITRKHLGDLGPQRIGLVVEVIAIGIDLVWTGVQPGRGAERHPLVTRIIAFMKLVRQLRFRLTQLLTPFPGLDVLGPDVEMESAIHRLLIALHHGAGIAIEPDPALHHPFCRIRLVHRLLIIEHLRLEIADDGNRTRPEAHISGLDAEDLLEQLGTDASLGDRRRRRRGPGSVSRLCVVRRRCRRGRAASGRLGRQLSR